MKSRDVYRGHFKFSTGIGRNHLPAVGVGEGCTLPVAVGGGSRGMGGSEGNGSLVGGGVKVAVKARVGKGVLVGEIYRVGINV